MSGLELAALAALGVGYVDARLDYFNDLARAKNLIKSSLAWGIAQKRNKINVFNILEYWVHKDPNKLFLVFPEPVVEAAAKAGSPLEDHFVVRRYTYGEVHERAQKVSAWLVKEHGIKAGDTVAIDFVNKPELVFLWFGLWNIGATPALINYNLSGKSLQHCVNISKSKLLLVDEDVADAGFSTEAELKADNVLTILADKSLFAHIYRTYAPIPFANVPVEIFDAGCYIFTSGTTGLPKAATMSWKKSYWGAYLYSMISYYSRNDVLYSAMPLYHSTAAVLGLMAILHQGGTYAIGYKFSTTTFWVQARLSRATSIQYVGETGRYLLNAPPSPDDKNHTVRVAHGNGMRPDVWLKFKERFNVPVISEFYAATESPSALNNYQRGAFGIGACGQYGSVATAILHKSKWNIASIDQDTQELLRDPKTGLCREARPDEPGELLFFVDPKNVKNDFQGYVGNQKATDEKVAFDVFRKGDAWFRSGDLLRTDRDNCVYFVDRLGDTFRWKSENVSTNEVEEAVTELDEVDVCVCVGVKVPQHEGRAGFAVIKPKDPEKRPDMTKLGRHLLDRLPRYAVPIFVKFVQSVDITGNNKIQKKAFRDQKIPAQEGETLYWLEGDTYKPLTPEAWARVEQGRHKL